MRIERVLLFDLDTFLKNFLQDIMNGKFPAIAQSHGQMGFHALDRFCKQMQDGLVVAHWSTSFEACASC